MMKIHRTVCDLPLRRDDYVSRLLFGQNPAAMVQIANFFDGATNPAARPSSETLQRIIREVYGLPVPLGQSIKAEGDLDPPE